MSSENLPRKVLIVDDDRAVLRSTETILEKLGVKVEKAFSLETALYLFNQNKFDVAIIEVEFSPLSGLALIQKWRKHEHPEKQATGFILMTGNKTFDPGAKTLIQELGDLEVIVKPFSQPQVLPVLVRAMLARQKLLAYLESQQRVLEYLNKTQDVEKSLQYLKHELPHLGSKGFHMICELYDKAGKNQQALELIEKKLQSDPTNISLLNAKASKLLKLDRHSEAKAVFQVCDEVAPKNIERVNQLVTAHLHLKEGDDAVKRMKELVNFAPEDPELKFSLFSKLYDFGLDEHAINFGRDAAQPMEIVKHYNNKGVLLAKEGSAGKAMKEYQRALAYFPKYKENYRIHFNLALSLLHLNRPELYEQAIRHLNTCLKLSPEFEKAKKALIVAEKLCEQSKKLPKKAPPKAS